MLPKQPKTVHGCSLHCMVTARLTSEWPGSIVPHKGNVNPFGGHW